MWFTITLPQAACWLLVRLSQPGDDWHNISQKLLKRNEKEERQSFVTTWLWFWSKWPWGKVKAFIPIGWQPALMTHKLTEIVRSVLSCKLLFSAWSLELFVLMICFKIACSYSRNACLRNVRSCWRKLRRSKKSCRRLNPNSTWWRKKRSGVSRGRDDSCSATAPSCSWWPSIARWVSHHILTLLRSRDWCIWDICGIFYRYDLK